jgi:hypothetical protein
LLHKNSSPLTSLHKAPSVTARCVLWAVKKTRWKRSRKWMPSAKKALAACAIVPVSICCACFFFGSTKKKRCSRPLLLAHVTGNTPHSMRLAAAFKRVPSLPAAPNKSDVCVLVAGVTPRDSTHEQGKQADDVRRPALKMRVESATLRARMLLRLYPPGALVRSSAPARPMSDGRRAALLICTGLEDADLGRLLPESKGSAAPEPSQPRHTANVCHLDKF